ncbi:conjugal transfer protein TraF [candidate division KSB1 bacterium]|nr:conjugal transfer protein TraF [candidate division KSB1 bacterium]
MKKIKLITPGHRLLPIIFIALATAFVNHAIAAAGISNARAVGLAGAYLSIAEGAEAPNWNPANLGLYDRQGFSMNFLSTGIRIHNNSFSKKQYDEYNGKYLDDADKQKLMDCIPDKGLTLNLDSEVQLLGFAYSYFAFTAIGVVESNMTISKEFFELGLYGNAHKLNFDFSDTDGTAWATYNYALSGAYPIDIQGFERFAVGGNLKYIQGLYCFDVVEAGGAISTDAKLYGEGKSVVQYARGGSGFGLDLGAAAILNDHWRFGLVLNNISNSVNWNVGAKKEVFWASTDSLDIQTMIDADEVDSLFHDDNETEDIKSFSTNKPVEMRLGAAYTANKYMVSLDYIQGFKEGVSISTTPKLASGIEYKPCYWLPLRAGMFIGGKEFFALAIGLGFEMGRVRLDFAATNQGSIKPGSQQGTTLAFGIRLIP